MAAEPQKAEGGWGDSRSPAPPSQNASEREFGGSEKEATLVCGHCRSHFSPQRKGQKFCSPKCRRDAWEKKGHGTATVAEEPLPVKGIILVMHGKKLGSLFEIPCGFCHRPNRVDPRRNGRQNAICRCGARYFVRLRRWGSGPLKISGWRKGKREAIYL